MLLKNYIDWVKYYGHTEEERKRIRRYVLDALEKLEEENSNDESNLYNEIETGLEQAIEYEKGNKI